MDKRFKIRFNRWRLPINNLFWVTLVAIAMGLLECSVVIYLRELIYPDGFQFPLRGTSYTVEVTELLRELSTMIMLLGIGVLAGRNKQERFAWFIYSFAIWDLFYYLFLYLIIGWPASLLDWDLLFLIPIMWIGPVWAPVLLSFLMILLAISILCYPGHKHNSNLKLSEWIVLTAGAIIIIVAFCKDYYLYISNKFPAIPYTQLFFSKNSFTYANQYVPTSFDVAFFLGGCAVLCAGIGLYTIRQQRELKWK